MAKKDKILMEVIKVIRSYSQKLTLRQIYYRLVAKLVIENKISQYKYLSRILVDARKSGEIPYNAMEDRTREVKNKAKLTYKPWKEYVDDLLDEIKDPFFHITNKLFQENIMLIALEKQALEGIFVNALENNAILVVCRGYNSLTQIHDLSKILEGDDRQVHCRFFSDFDPSGLDIQRNFVEQCNDLGVVFSSFKRVALTERQIKKYNLPFAPTKSSDTRAKNWNYRGVVELDALEPKILTKIIKNVCQEHWDNALEDRVSRFERVLYKRFKRKYAKELIKIAKTMEEENSN